MNRALDLLFKLILGILILFVCFMAGLLTVAFMPIGTNVTLTVGLVLGTIAAFGVTHIYVVNFQCNPADAIPFGFVCFAATVMIPAMVVISGIDGFGAPIEAQATAPMQTDCD